MALGQKVALLAVRHLVRGACDAVGVKGGDKAAAAVVGFLHERLVDQSQRVTVALRKASESAWKALEVALAGDTLWQRCQALLARGEERAFAHQVRAFLDAAPLPALEGKTTFRRKCLEELRAARTAGALSAGFDAPKLARQAAGFARFADHLALVEAEWRVVTLLAEDFKQAGYPSLGWLLAQRPATGLSLLAVASRYFFRRAVEEDARLFQGLAFARLEALDEAQERGFAALADALGKQGNRLEELLGDVKAAVVQTHAAVLDVQGQLRGQSEQIQQIGQAVLRLLEQHRLQRRALRPGDSLSVRTDEERQLVKQVVARYRALPEPQRRGQPALLNAVGKLEVAAGDFEAAQQDFLQAAALATDPAAQAEARFNAYQTALERRDFDAALRELLEAVKLDPARYAPFPVAKYQPRQILGTGGFGTAFLCRHRYMNADVVVKALHPGGLGREADQVFTEAQVLRQLDHPAIIRITECGYADVDANARPHIVMDYFPGRTLEEQVRKEGPLPVVDALAVARQAAEGLLAAHGKGILHRDVKPANLLVRKDGAGWHAKLIDFGLALQQQTATAHASTARQVRTAAGGIAGTPDYAAPEQVGRLPGVAVTTRSDIYDWARTCCYALFRTAQPLLKHWQSVPPALAKLLEDCLAEQPQERPTDFRAVLSRLDGQVAATNDAPADMGLASPWALGTEPAAVPKPGALPPEEDRESRRGAERNCRAIRRRFRVALVAGLAVATLAAVLLVLLRNGQPGGAPGTPRTSAGGPADEVRKRFRGKADLDLASGRLSLRYDFREPGQLADFDLMKSRPEVGGGLLKLEPGESIRHVVPFKSVTVKSAMTIRNTGGRHLATTGGYGLGYRGDGGSGLLVRLLVGPDAEVASDYVRGVNGFVNFPVSLAITGERVVLNHGDNKLGKAISGKPAGQVELYGGDGGNDFRELDLSGEVDAEWIKAWGGPSPVGDSGGPKTAPTMPAVSTESLRSRFHGRCEHDANSDQLTLVYDFKGPDQLKDFEAAPADCEISEGRLRVRKGKTLRHSIMFQTLLLRGRSPSAGPVGSLAASTWRRPAATAWACGVTAARAWCSSYWGTSPSWHREGPTARWRSVTPYRLS